MDRLTTNNPKNNLETALNLFYVKDGQAWVRCGGPEPDYKDCSLYDYIRETMAGVLDHVYVQLTDEEIGSIMPDWLMDGHCCIPGLIAHLYTAAWAFAELRERLMKYEEAEEEGRLWIAPCKIKTPIHMVITDRNSVPVYPPSYVVTTYLTESNLVHAIKGFGKTVFLTRKEAEDALAKLKEA